MRHTSTGRPPIAAATVAPSPRPDSAPARGPRPPGAAPAPGQAADPRRARRPPPAPRLGPGRRQDRHIVEDHDGVLDEHAVGVLVGGLELDDVPPPRAERIDVAAPLG